MLFDLKADRNQLSLAVDNPDNFRATDDLQTLLGFNIKAFLANANDLQTALDRYYPEGEQESISGLIGELTDDEDLARFEGRGDSIDLMELKEIADLNPVKKLLNLVLLQAIKEKASDIHFEPGRDGFHVRYRVHGLMREAASPPQHMASAIVSRLKIMADMDVSEKRIPQDGRFRQQIGGADIDFRASSLPTIHGEKIVLRILDRRNLLRELDSIGMPKHVLDGFGENLQRPEGLHLQRQHETAIIVDTCGRDAKAQPSQDT